VKKHSKGTILTLVAGASNSSEIAREAETAVASMAAEIAQREERNSKRFLQMEEPVRDAALMAEIVQDLMINADLEIDSNERTAWAVFHLCDMLKDLRGLYRDGELADEDGAPVQSS